MSHPKEWPTQRLGQAHLAHAYASLPRALCPKCNMQHPEEFILSLDACYCCRLQGHYARECRRKLKTAERRQSVELETIDLGVGLHDQARRS
jgi:hypothetical protein